MFSSTSPPVAMLSHHYTRINILFLPDQLNQGRESTTNSGAFLRDEVRDIMFKRNAIALTGVML